MRCAPPWPHHPGRRLATGAIACITPPATSANGHKISGVAALPYQPASHDPSITVPITNPNRPMIDGAAIGIRNTLMRASQAS
jgi:hypothetical protein